MTLIDWTTVDLQPLTLTLEQEADNYIVVDARDGDTVYLRSPDLWLCVRFMRAMVVKKQAVVDEAAVERLIDGIGWFSLKVPEGSLTPGGFAEPADTPSRWTDGARTPEAGVGDNFEGSGDATPDGGAAASPDSTSPKLRLVL